MESPLLGSRPAAHADAAAWFDPLLAPVRARVASIASAIPGRATARSGLAAAIAVGLARSYGTRRWQEAARAAIAMLEAADRRVHLEITDEVAAANLLRADAARLRRVWDGLVRREPTLLDRVLDRAVAGASLGAEPLPEAVLTLRGAVAAGVLCGAVDDVVHATADRVATWLGLAMEASYGALTADAWRGALAAVALDAPFPDDPGGYAVAQAVVACHQLPDGDFAERLAEVAHRLPAHLADERVFRAYVPRPAPPPVPVPDDPLEATLAAVVATDARPVARAVAFVQGQGGKRVRPAMARAAAAACGGSDADALVPAALLEWLHQASLVIDDQIDAATVRRGGPTLHHATDAPFAFAIAAHILARLQIAARPLDAKVRAALFDAATALAEGQRQELAHTGDDQLSVSHYYGIIEAKTARLFGCAAVLGARTAHASENTVRALGRYGREAGLAFQIVDDVLDYFGDERSFGKRPGTDLRAGKVTLPLLLLRDRLDAKGRETLAVVLRSGPEARKQAFPWVIDRMRALDIEPDALSRARVHRGRAIDALSEVPPGPGRDELASLADRFVARVR